MAVQKHFRFAQKVFASHDITKGMKAAIEAAGSDIIDTSITMEESRHDGTRSHEKVSWDRVDGVCDLYAEKRSLHFSVDHVEFLQSKNTSIHLSAEEPDMLTVWISTHSSERMQTFAGLVERSLALAPHEPPELEEVDDEELVWDELEKFEHRIARLEAALGRSDLRIFLSYRFNRAVSEEYAAQVEHFLRLLKVEVVTARGYEPRSVTDKVKEKLQPGIDGIVVIIEGGESSDWLRDEAAVAIARDADRIILKEDGSTFTPGLHGDVEYISFAPGHIGDVFLKLLQGVEFLRGKKASRENASPAASKAENSGP